MMYKRQSFEVFFAKSTRLGQHGALANTRLANMASSSSLPPPPGTAGAGVVAASPISISAPGFASPAATSGGEGSFLIFSSSSEHLATMDGWITLRRSNGLSGPLLCPSPGLNPPPYRASSWMRDLHPRRALWLDCRHAPCIPHQARLGRAWRRRQRAQQ